MCNKSMIQIENVTKVFDSKEVLKDLNITVEAGTVYGLLGENGAGKTTTFKILAGLLSPTAGTVKIQGNEISDSNHSFLKNMGILIETPVFYEHLSAKENLEIHLDYMGCDKGKMDDALAMVGLKDTGKQPVSQFSLGMKQRLAIARAISHSPRILKKAPISSFRLCPVLADISSICVTISSLILIEKTLYPSSPFAFFGFITKCFSILKFIKQREFPMKPNSLQKVSYLLLTKSDSVAW